MRMIVVGWWELGQIDRSSRVAGDAGRLQSYVMRRVCAGDMRAVRTMEQLRIHPVGVVRSQAAR